jgi:hypothetical protein
MIQNHIDNKPVLIVCDKGVNRSVAVAIGFAIMVQGWTFNRAIDYIDTMKLTKYPLVWNSLTNQTIRNLLKILPQSNTPE